MKEDNLISSQEMIMTAFSNIDCVQLEKNNSLLKTWRLTIESIRSNAVNGNNLGENLFAHSRVVDLKNGILLIEADHPAWIQTLRLYQKYIITGLKRGVKDVKISSLAFRLRGTNVELHNQINDEKIRKNMEKRLEKEEIIIRKFDENNNEVKSDSEEKNKEIPENLRQILDRLKSDILTDNN